MFPRACRQCGCVFIGDTEVRLPEAIKESMKEAAVAASEAGIEAQAAMVKDPGQRIERWFTSVFHRGYQHGFFRALGYFQHHAKEGRLFRLRELWQGSDRRLEDTFHDDAVPGERVCVVRFEPKAYNEFHQLLMLGLGVKLDAKSDENPSPAGKGRNAHV